MCSHMLLMEIIAHNIHKSAVYPRQSRAVSLCAPIYKHPCMQTLVLKHYREPF